MEKYIIDEKIKNDLINEFKDRIDADRVSDVYEYIINLLNDIIDENENEDVSDEWSSINQISEFYYTDFHDDVRVIYDYLLNELYIM